MSCEDRMKMVISERRSRGTYSDTDLFIPTQDHLQDWSTLSFKCIAFYDTICDLQLCKPNLTQPNLT
jgi:hypothetical protein